MSVWPWITARATPPAREGSSAGAWKEYTPRTTGKHYCSVWVQELTNQIERGVLSLLKGNLTVSKNQTNLNLQRDGKEIITLIIIRLSFRLLLWYLQAHLRRQQKAAKAPLQKSLGRMKNTNPSSKTNTTEWRNSPGATTWLLKSTALVQPQLFYFSKI